MNEVKTDKNNPIYQFKSCLKLVLSGEIFSEFWKERDELLIFCFDQNSSIDEKSYAKLYNNVIDFYESVKKNPDAKKQIEEKILQIFCPHQQNSQKEIYEHLQIVCDEINQNINILFKCTYDVYFWAGKKKNGGMPEGIIEIRNVLQDSAYTHAQKWILIKTIAENALEFTNTDLFRDKDTTNLYVAIVNNTMKNLVVSRYCVQNKNDLDEPTFIKESVENSHLFYNNASPLPIILRLEKESDFESIPIELQESISKHFGIKSWDKKHFIIEIISDDESYQKHYLIRLDAIHAGALLVLETLPENHFYKKNSHKLIEFLNSYANTYRQKIAHLKNNAIDTYQNILSEYTRLILDLLIKEVDMDKKEAIHYLGRAEEFALAKKPRPALCTIKKLSHDDKNEYYVMLDKPENPFYLKVNHEFEWIKSEKLSGYPQWYLALDPHEKDLIKNMLQSNVEINCISSKLRIIPIPANYGTHTLITYMNSNLTVHPDEIRLSHIGSRDVKDIELRKEYAIRNLRHVIFSSVENKIKELKKLGNVNSNDQDEIVIPILFQTLITPWWSPDKELDWDKQYATAIIQNLLDQQKYSINGVKIKFQIISTNHPLNYAKHLPVDSSTVKQVKKFINICSTYRRDNSLLDAVLSELEAIVEYKNMDGSLQLHIVGLEQLAISLCGGISIGSCVSGKDRKGVELMYTDAMKIYHEKYKQVLTYQDIQENNNPKQKAFAEIFAEIYCSRHLQTSAGQNSPGSNGIKTPDMYLPEFLKNAIKAWYENATKTNIIYAHKAESCFKESEILASNNEIKVIINSGKSNKRNMIDSVKIIEYFKIETKSEMIQLINESLLIIIAYLKSCKPDIIPQVFIYKELLENPCASLDQKLVVLLALMDENTAKDFQMFVLKNLGHNNSSTIQKIICSHLHKQALPGILTIAMSISKNVKKKPDLKNLRYIKNNLNDTFPNEKSIFLPKYELEKMIDKAIAGVKNYIDSTSTTKTMKGILRAYAYAHLLETLPNIEQKIIALYAILHFNGEEPPKKLQYFVCTELGYENIHDARKSISLICHDAISNPFKIIHNPSTIKEMMNMLNTLKDNQSNIECLKIVKEKLNESCFQFQFTHPDKLNEVLNFLFDESNIKYLTLFGKDKVDSNLWNKFIGWHDTFIIDNDIHQMPFYSEFEELQNFSDAFKEWMFLLNKLPLAIDKKSIAILKRGTKDFLIQNPELLDYYFKHMKSIFYHQNKITAAWQIALHKEKLLNFFDYFMNKHQSNEKTFKLLGKIIKCIDKDGVRIDLSKEEKMLLSSPPLLFQLFSIIELNLLDSQTEIYYNRILPKELKEVFSEVKLLFKALNTADLKYSSEAVNNKLILFKRLLNAIKNYDTSAEFSLKDLDLIKDLIPQNISEYIHLLPKNLWNIDYYQETPMEKFKDALLKTCEIDSVCYSSECGKFAQKIRLILKSENSKLEKFFQLAMATYTKYNSLYIKTSRFSMGLKQCLDEFLPQLFEQNILPHAYQKYAMERISKQNSSQVGCVTQFFQNNSLNNFIIIENYTCRNTDRIVKNNNNNNNQ